MRTLILGCGSEALVDDLFVPLLSIHKWRIEEGYAIASIGGVKVRMHNLVFGPIPSGKTVDHIDRNPLNNTRSNLRAVHYSLQSFNQGKRGSNTGHRCVSLNRYGTYTVIVSYQGQRYRKSFKTVEEAVEYRNSIWLEIYGEVAE